MYKNLEDNYRYEGHYPASQRRKKLEVYIGDQPDDLQLVGLSKEGPFLNLIFHSETDFPVTNEGAALEDLLKDPGKNRNLARKFVFRDLHARSATECGAPRRYKLKGEGGPYADGETTTDLNHPHLLILTVAEMNAQVVRFWGPNRSCEAVNYDELIAQLAAEEKALLDSI